MTNDKAQRPNKIPNPNDKDFITPLAPLILRLRSGHALRGEPVMTNDKAQRPNKIPNPNDKDFITPLAPLILRLRSGHALRGGTRNDK
jgi:hypothetical protein